ncbi:cardiolipin synthase [Fictibacillus iocasae]|uniref:Cardiolipin synthase n=1 Tax=Fictibacillus iocasae TaxID=2715437 RepID=A0ABW2NLM8_9BACL
MKRVYEFLLSLLLIGSLYAVLFAQYPFYLKLLFGLLYTVIILHTIFSLILENRTAQNTLLWIYVLVFLPVIGYIFYLYSGQLYLKGHLFKSKRKNDREEWVRVTKENEKPDFTGMPDHQRCFAYYAHNVALTKMNSSTKTTILKNGSEKFPELKKRLLEAQKYIHIQYYIFRSDRLGKEIMEILMKKAREGVEVRFLFDGIGSLSLQQSDIDEMKKAGVKVHAFLPVRYGFFNQKLNFRNHRKIVIIDGVIGFTGGLNVGVEYEGLDPTIGFWRDTHMLIEGEAVQTLHAIFLLDWEYVCGEDLFEHENYTKPTRIKGDGEVHVVASGPDTQQGIMSDFYYTMISCAKKSIWIATPYFVPNEAIRAALKIANQKGVKVRIMVPEINDGFLTQYATRSYFPELLRCGTEIYSYKKGFLHQKVIIVDGDMASIGTANMDMRSFHLNFEVNAFLFNCSSVKELISQYEEDMEESSKVGAVEFYKRGLAERSKESFARLFSGVL